MNFHKFGILTIIAVYLLIFVGGVVRSTGSGMGCPDWPKCFGMWVPPTSVDQLPLNYQEIYSAKLKGEVIFNPVKTWIEYLNRLLGALIGVFVFVTFLFSTKYWNSNRKITLWSGFAVLLTGFQGWVGSKVVSSELATYMVSVHMLIAILIVFVLIFTLFKSNYFKVIDQVIPVKGTLSFIWLVFTVTLIQVLLGTQVREKIDIIAKAIGEAGRGDWVENAGLNFLIHRSFSIIVLSLHIYLFLKLRKLGANTSISNLNNSILIVIGLEILSGISLNYLGFPAFLQPIHLTLAIVALGLQIILIFTFSQRNNLELNKI